MDTLKIIDGYYNDAAVIIANTDRTVTAEIAEALAAAYFRGARVFTAGNGGSASTASHTANDLVKGCAVGGKCGFNALCLSDSSPVVTCLANDFCYEDIYLIQLKTFAKQGDVLCVFSGSGNSENVVRAARYAREQGIVVLGFLGRDGGKTLPYCDIGLIAPTDCMEAIEDVHLTAEHAVTTALRQILIKENR